MPKSRLEAFSDGVIAVIITILILDIRLPVTGPSGIILSQAIFSLLPKIVSYVVSFSLIAVWWVAHHQLFGMIDKTDRGLLWLNSLFLLTLSFTPFPTAVIGEYPLERASILLYGVSGLLSAMSFVAMRWYVTFKAKLVSQRYSQEVLKLAFLRGLVSPALYLLAIVIGLFSPKMALGIFIFIPCYFFLPMSWWRRD